MKILTLDIETSPNLAHVWSIWNQNVGLSQLLESAEVLCFAAKWYDCDDVLYYSQFHDGREDMVIHAHELLDEADVVVHYNGKRFDMPHLNREFVELGMTPPAPYAQVDLLSVVKKQFRFPSNKLDYVAQTLGLGAKETHTGHQLWRDCLSGKEEAWDLMQTYNEHDVVLTEALYDRLLPWISPHPTVGLYDSSEVPTCPNCGSENIRPRGRAYTSVSVYQRYRCHDCGRWSRSGSKVAGVEVRGLA